MKTIRMPKADLEMVLATLRHKPNAKRQGRGKLFDGHGYCCLGLMQCAKSGGKVEVEGSDEFAAFPSMDWLRSVGWSFTDRWGNPDNNPYLPTLGVHASDANDDERKTFAEIADAIEACAEGV